MKVSDLLDNLIEEGKTILAGCKSTPAYTSGNISYAASPPSATDSSALKRWLTKVVLLESIMGRSIKPWKHILEASMQSNLATDIDAALAVLETIRYAFDEGLLTTYDDLLYAEAFGDLCEQGQHLLSQGYFLAAGVIFRAVLEEQLRRLCEKHACSPEKGKPTINDLNTALYKCEPPVYSKSVMMQITALAAVGNDAAHNKPELTKEDVKRLEDGLLEFLASFSE